MCSKIVMCIHDRKKMNELKRNNGKKSVSEVKNCRISFLVAVAHSSRRFFFLLNFIVSIIMWDKSGSVENLLRTCRSFVYGTHLSVVYLNAMLWWSHYITQRTLLSHSLKRFNAIILISTIKVRLLLRLKFLTFKLLKNEVKFYT